MNGWQGKRALYGKTIVFFVKKHEANGYWFESAAVLIVLVAVLIVVLVLILIIVLILVVLAAILVLILILVIHDKSSEYLYLRHCRFHSVPAFL